MGLVSSDATGQNNSNLASLTASVVNGEWERAFRGRRLNSRRDVINQAGLPDNVRGGRIRKTGLADSKAFPKALDEARA
jgi:hypothetical protein